MTVSANFAPVLARMAADQLCRCWPLLNDSVKSELVALLEPRAAVAAAQLACKRAGEPQHSEAFVRATLRADLERATCSFCGTPGQVVGACCVNCGEQV